MVMNYRENDLNKVVCFICTTPFQIITAINITRHKELYADLYIVPQFSNAKELSNSISDADVFRKVIYVDTSQIEEYKKSKYKLFLHLGIAWNYLRISSVVKKFLLDDVTYSVIYVSSKANIGRLTALYYIKRGINFRTVFFDDGESSYDNEAITNPSKADQKLRRAIFGKEAVRPINELWLYSPSLFQKINPDSSVVVNQLPLIPQDDDTKLLYNKIFRVSSSDLISERAIILDIIKNENLEGRKEDLIAIYKIIADVFGSNQTIIKKHPRDKSQELETFKYYKKSEIPFEILLLNQDLSNKVLVTVSSTAITIPKLLFNVEPIVIYLGNLVKTKQARIGKATEYYEACKRTYDDPNRFIIPESIEDLKYSLKQLKER